MASVPLSLGYHLAKHTNDVHTGFAGVEVEVLDLHGLSIDSVHVFTILFLLNLRMKCPMNIFWPKQAVNSAVQESTISSCCAAVIANKFGICDKQQ